MLPLALLNEIVELGSEQLCCHLIIPVGTSRLNDE